MTDPSVWRVLSYWPVVIFWPAIVVALTVAGVGIARRRVSLLIGGAGLMLPAALYLAATPRFQLVGVVPVVCLLAAAWATRRKWTGLGRVLVAVSVVFWTVVASTLVFPLVLHLVVAGAAIGFVAAGPLSWKSAVYVPASIVGAFVGALLSFGDAPLLMRYPHLNPWTLSVLAAVVVVAGLRLAEKRFDRRHPGPPSRPRVDPTRC